MSDSPTPETHRYVGMWRPPFETVTSSAQEQFGQDGFFICKCQRNLCGCDDSLDDGRFLHTGKVLDHWLAGHFDEPQYEAKKEEASEPKSYTIRWHRDNETFGRTDIGRATSAVDAVEQFRSIVGADDRIVDEVSPAK